MESTLPTSHLLTAGLLSGLHLLFIICWPWSKVFLMSAFFGISSHHFNLFSKSVSVGFHPKTNVPWPSVASMGGNCHLKLFICWVMTSTLDATIVIESETAGCIDTLSPWRLYWKFMIWNKWCSLMCWFHFDLKVDSPLGTQPTNKSLSIVYSLRLIDTRPDSHWNLSNMFAKNKTCSQCPVSHVNPFFMELQNPATPTNLYFWEGTLGPTPSNWVSC